MAYWVIYYSANSNSSTPARRDWMEIAARSMVNVWCAQWMWNQSLLAPSVFGVVWRTVILWVECLWRPLFIDYGLYVFRYFSGVSSFELSAVVIKWNFADWLAIGDRSNNRPYKPATDNSLQIKFYGTDDSISKLPNNIRYIQVMRVFIAYLRIKQPGARRQQIERNRIFRLDGQS